MRFLAGCKHPSVPTFPVLHISMYDLKQAASNWYALHHVTFMTFNPDIRKYVAGPFCLLQG